MKTNTKIAIFFGGKISQHLVMLKKAGKKLGVRLDLVSYNRICFDTEEQKVIIRGNLADGTENKVKNEGWLQINDYDVLFFRTTGKHWEEVDLITESLKSKNLNSKPVIIDPIIEFGKPSMACKAYQMLALKKAGIEVPKTVYGSLWYLYETMQDNQNPLSTKADISPHKGGLLSLEKGNKTCGFTFPVIIKGSGGDRGTRVYMADNLEDLEKLVRDLRKSETEEGKRYMLQEFIENDGDYRVLVLGDKVLGIMKRSRVKLGVDDKEFRNNFSVGGTVEVADLPESIKELAVKAAKVCGLAVAGVDVAFRNYDINKPVIWEVNKGPQFKGFMQATGIDVPKEIVKFLVGLKTNL